MPQFNKKQCLELGVLKLMTPPLSLSSRVGSMYLAEPRSIISDILSFFLDGVLASVLTCVSLFGNKVAMVDQRKIVQ